VFLGETSYSLFRHFERMMYVSSSHNVQRHRRTDRQRQTDRPQYHAYSVQQYDRLKSKPVYFCQISMLSTLNVNII